MRVYLDNCILNRQFDDQSQIRIQNETASIKLIHTKIRSFELELIWSYLNEFESSRNPFADIREAISEWRRLAFVYVPPSISIVRTAYDLRELGLKAIDSLHVAAAIEAKSDYFLSTDDGILSKVTEYGQLRLLNPTAFVAKA
ncbi:MAG TPA: PIN domain-containing protein [Pyrinomonadaceae bacterium]|nr:PIN domain-containing protein [Pyrinomonadaceae bacterium]